MTRGTMGVCHSTGLGALKVLLSNRSFMAVDSLRFANGDGAAAANNCYGKATIWNFSGHSDRYPASAKNAGPFLPLLWLRETRQHWN